MCVNIYERRRRKKSALSCALQAPGYQTQIVLYFNRIKSSNTVNTFIQKGKAFLYEVNLVSNVFCGLIWNACSLFVVIWT